MSCGEDLRCDELVEMLVEYFGDELTADARAALRGHCAICPDCDNFVRTYAATLSLTERVLGRHISEADRVALEARIFTGRAGFSDKPPQA